jgi:PhoH-like ATPase
MHDPSALFRFQEHDVYLPMAVLEELDSGKKGTSEIARNARQASRFLDDLVGDADGDAIDRGIELPGPNNGTVKAPARGRLFLQTNLLEHDVLPPGLPSNRPDNNILATTAALKKLHMDRSIVLVSKDINLRIKARALGIAAEDYYSDKVLDDAALLYSGTAELPVDFWETHGRDVECKQDKIGTVYTITGPLVERWLPNQCLYLEGEEAFAAIVRGIEAGKAKLKQVIDYRANHRNVWGVYARNREQNFALNLLMNPEIDLITLMGTAGTGKTLLALAAGLEQTLEQKLYREIVMTRVTVPVGEDIGFLPGTEEEKMTPWMGALMDNLEVLMQTDDHSSWGRAATEEILKNRIKIRSLNFMRGRTFLSRYVIIDEAQNLTPKQIKTLITRAGPGTKLVCLGNIEQIDTPYLSETTSGLTYLVDRFKGWPHSAHVILRRGERSRLADYASEVL